MQTKTIKISRTCPFCDKDSSLDVPEDQYNKWVTGTHAQFAFPQLSADQREQIISGSHGECYDEAFGEDD